MTDRDGSGNSRLRRDRQFSDGTSIVSKLPSAADPRSRAYTTDRRLRALGGFLDARGRTKPIPESEFCNRVLCGDSASTLGLLPEGFATCAITSPPYWNQVDYGTDGQVGDGSYQQYRDQLLEVWKAVFRALKPNGKLCINVPILPLRKEVSAEHFGRTHTRMILDLYADIRQDLLQNTEFQAYSLYIWEKQTTEKMFGSYPFPPNLYENNFIEYIAVFVKPGSPPKIPKPVKEAARLDSKQWMELIKQIWWMYPENVKRSEGHPAPFPLALPNRLLHMYTFPGVATEGFEGDIVLDPFNGWGTTCVAAKRAGRRFVGIDLSPEFCTVACQRLSATQLRPGILEACRPSDRTDPQLGLFVED